MSRRSNRDKAGAEESDVEMEEEEAPGTVEKKVLDPQQIRLQLKQAPRPFFRYIQGREGSTLSLPIEEANIEAESPYSKKWDSIFMPPVKKQACIG